MIESIPYVLTGIGIIVSILYYTSVLRNANMTRELQLKAQEHASETRETTLFWQFFQELVSPEMWNRYIRVRYVYQCENYQEFKEQFNPHTNPEGYSDITSLWYTYIAIGDLLYDNKIGMDKIIGLLGEMPLRVWEKWSPIISELRKDYGWDGAYVSFEYLAKRIEEYLANQSEDIVVDVRKEIDTITSKLNR